MGITIKVRDRNNVPKFKRMLKQAEKNKVQVGVFTPASAEKAYAAEYGDPSNQPGPIPARPFMRETANKLGGSKKGALAKTQNVLMTNDVKDALAFMGEAITDIMRNVIYTASTWAAPLAEYTVKKKGHSRPLVDSEDMVRDVTYKVV